MTCEACEKATEGPGLDIAWYRIGTQELGWGNIGLVGCRDHVKLALEKLNDRLER